MTQAELEKRFSSICNKNHWKDEVHSLVLKKDFDEYNKAVIHFTGGSLQILSEIPMESSGVTVLEVYSEGYRYHIGS